MFLRLATKHQIRQIVLILSFLAAQAGFAPAHAAQENPQGPSSVQVRALGPIEKAFQHGGLVPSLAESDLITGAALSLLTYIRENVAIQNTEDPEIPRYNRIRHFGGWLRVKQGECLDTRAVVLIRDSSPKHPVKMREPDGCLVVKGHWDDPYSGETFKMAAAVQVDHVVPLRNAYYSGGHKWETARRCHYFNYIGNKFHLRTVSGHENMAKGDRSPDRYMPPNEEFHCQYLKEWMKVKTIWGLTVTAEELATIEQTLQNRGCRETDTVISSRELEEQRFRSETPIQTCIDFGNRVDRAEKAAEETAAEAQRAAQAKLSEAS